MSTVKKYNNRKLYGINVNCVKVSITVLFYVRYRKKIKECITFVQ
jgi:hypothetical protein